MTNRFFLENEKDSLMPLCKRRCMYSYKYIKRHVSKLKGQMKHRKNYIEKQSSKSVRNQQAEFKIMSDARMTRKNQPNTFYLRFVFPDIMNFHTVDI